MTIQKPFSDACQRNQQPIADLLAAYLPGPARVLELGSGTGQHGVFFARSLPQLQWQPTDLTEALPGIELWRQEAGLGNLAAPLALDVNEDFWPVVEPYDAVFTANTIHFVPWRTVENLLRGAAEALRKGGLCLIYGPFNEGGAYTSAGNAQLDQWLKKRDPDSGIKDRAAIVELAAKFGLGHLRAHRLPANNELLSFARG